ncbi:MAG: DUF1598 domain-containing protein [Pirellulaceae bacterium]
MKMASNFRPWVALVMLTSLGAVLCSTGNGIAGIGGFRPPAVGGISIDARGVVSSSTPVMRKELQSQLLKAMQPVPGDLTTPVPMRKVSLRMLEEEVKSAIANNNGVLPDSVKYLAGLQRVEYIFVSPENNDIVIAGPAEGWTVDDSGTVVGVTTGRPVLLLEDLLVALRTVDNARTVGITCSIDPTEQGRVNYRQFMEQVKAQGRTMDASVKAGIEQALGPQQITFTGVDVQSHFAHVLLAADYRMKRIAMELDPSPVRGLPSYLNMIRSPRADSTPRWWLACNYEPLAQSEDGLAWQIRGQGVKAMTEDELIDAQTGEVTQTGRTSALAQKWADLMTTKYEDLSAEDKVFGKLRNIMDLSVMAALMEKEHLLDKADLQIPTLRSQDSRLQTTQYETPKTLPTLVSAIKKGRNWIISASGGVEVDSWGVTDKTETDEKIAAVRIEHTAAKPDSWWWN